MILVRIKTTLLVLTSLCLCVAALVLAFRNAGSWLIVSDDPPDSLDMLFTFGGEVDRYGYSAELARKYPSAFWILSIGYFPAFDTLTLATIARRKISTEGFDTSRILVNDTCTSTGSEIELLADFVRCALLECAPSLPDSASPSDSVSYGEKRQVSKWFSSRCVDTLDIGLISHPYHMRRIRQIASLLAKKLPVRIYMLPIPVCGCTADKEYGARWWRNEKDASFVLSELIKIVYYGSVRRRVNLGEKLR